MRPFLVVVLALSACNPEQQRSAPPYKDATLPIPVRVQNLLGQMTPEEKFWQLFMIPDDSTRGIEQFRHGIFGLQVRPSLEHSTLTDSQLDSLSTAKTVSRINAVQKFLVEETRLGIPMIPFEEALHGLVSPGAQSYPVPIGLAATWDPALIHSVAASVAQETRRHGFRDVLSPVVNIATDPRWGRTEETYGEDPFLSSKMGVAFVSAFEKAGIITTPKHFVANSGDGGRDSYPIHYNKRMLEENYLPPFRACIAMGGSRSIMTSYNSVDGSPASAHAWLQDIKLKKEMNFRGFIISDAGAVGGANVLHFTAKDYEEATVKAMKNGAHVIFQTSHDHHKLFQPPFLDGRIDAQLIDSAVARVLQAKFELGLFEDPYVDSKNEYPSKDRKEGNDLALIAAQRSLVLLKNDRNRLPLSSSIRTLAVIGTDAVEGRLGGYSRPGSAEINILDALKGRQGSKTTVTYSPGPGRSSLETVVVPSAHLSHSSDGRTSPGLQAEYFNSIDLTGNPVAQRVDAAVNFRWTLFPPAPNVNFDFFSARWTGKLTAPLSGRFRIGFEGSDGYRLFLDGKLILDNWKNQTAGGKLVVYEFQKGKEYDLRVEFFESSGISSLKLVWDAEVIDDWKSKVKEAVAQATKADVALIVAGIEEGEGLDRAYLGLPGHQEELIAQVSATGKPVVVVLVGGSAITMTRWIDKVDAVVCAWYPGNQGGRAVSDVLFGNVNPAGRLPISFPVFEGQLPYAYNHKPTGRNDDYADLTGEPLFPFGFGLSYSTFAYSALKFDNDSIEVGESALVRFKVKNTSNRDGEEVIQLYVRDVLATVAQPIKQLKGFQRVFLKAGEEKEFSFELTPELLQILNDEMRWVVEPGEFRIMIGGSSRDIRLRGILFTKP